MSAMTAARSNAAPTTQTNDERNPRTLNFAEQKVRSWIKKHHGVLSRISESTGYSVQYVSRIAYNFQGTRSAGLRVEHALKAAGCPMIQKI